jgi:hypothetical protein
VGTEKNHPYIGDILEEYKLIENGSYPTSPEIMTKCYHRYEEKEGLNILNSCYFYPLLDGEHTTVTSLQDAYTNHLWHESWRTYVPFRRFIRRIGLMKIYHKLLTLVKG